MVPSDATAMSAPWLFGVPPGPPVETVLCGEKLAPPSVERANFIGELAKAPWKLVHATYTLPEHGLAVGELRSTSSHSLSVKSPAKPITPGTANPTAPLSTTGVPRKVNF